MLTNGRKLYVSELTAPDFIAQSFQLILSGTCTGGWWTSFHFFVDCASKLHTIYGIIDINRIKFRLILNDLKAI